MKSPILLRLIAAAVLLTAFALIVQSITHKTVPLFVWVLIPVYGMLTLFLYSMITSAAGKSPQRFVTAVNGSLIIKLFLTIAIVGSYLYLGYPGKKALALSVMGIYLVNTAVLIWTLVPVLRGKKKE